MRRDVAIGSVLLVLLLTVSVVSAAPLLAISVPDAGSGSTTVVMQNTHATEDSSWVLDFIDSAGSSVAGAQQSGSLPPYVSTGVNVANLTTLGTGWNGSAIVSSDREMAAVGYTLWSGGASGDGTTAGEYAAFSEGFDELTFPYSFNSNRVTAITIQNTSSTDEDVYFSFVDRRTGAQSGSTTMVTIPGGAQRTYMLSDCSSGIVPNEVCTRPTSDTEGDYWKGSTVVTSTNPSLAGVASNHWYRWTGQYVGVPQGESANELIFPLFFRVRNYQGTFGEDQPFQRYSDMNIANPDLSATTTITISLYRVDGVLSKEWSTDIPPGSSVAVNTRFGGVGSPADWQTSFPADLQDASGDPNWLGAAIVTAEAGKQIQGVCFNFWPSSNADYVVGYNAVTRALGQEMLYFPVAHRGGSGPTFFTQAQIQNLETSDTTVDIYFFDRDAATGGVGNELYKLDGIVVPANSSVSLNSRFNSTGFPADWMTNLGTSFHGTVVVDSRGGDIAGVAFNLNNTSGARRASGYNGVLP